LQQIDHNSINLNRIPTKIGTEMRFKKLFICTTFQIDSSMNSQVIANNARSAKRIRKKRRNYFGILVVSISGLAGAICFKFGQIHLVWGHCSSKFG